MIKILRLHENRPEWLNNEGHWRILKVLRVLIAVPIALFGAAVVLFNAIQLMSDRPDGEAHIVLILGCIVIALAFAAFFIVQGVARMICWIRAGFAEHRN
ncbi:hypothetical protein [Pseudomonas fluorescens]|uniref:Transmembrane protein n=1 Tax=Pseudomonas fluorescens TaxID=294 RepID=A0A5E7CTW3_PSEFL|nr:hypothetical protein [Pseudomonas fluorescens]VVO08477.1 hypothetical protein PS710_03250 [Pseudomonas fluorescens]